MFKAVISSLVPARICALAYYSKTLPKVIARLLLDGTLRKATCGDVNLDGVKVGVWLHAPGHLTEGNWRLALYVDEQASDAQFDAICALWSGEGGGHLSVIASLVGEVMSAKKAKNHI